MTERDTLLERLEQVNPVPDPSRLHEDLQKAPRPVPGGDVDAVVRRTGESRTRRGLLVATAAAALVILAGAAITLMAIDSRDPVAGGARLLELTIAGDSCVYEGPSTLAAGDVEIVYRNTSPESRWANTLRLDDDRTVTDALNYTADDPWAGPPSWSSAVWLALSVSADSASTSRLVTLEPGTYLLLCGDAARGAVFGADVVVTP